MRRLIISLLLVLPCGCATVPSVYFTDDPAAELAYFATAQTANPDQLESMWSALSEAPPSAGVQLRRGLLLSLPGHSHANPAAAIRELESLSTDHPRSPRATIARVRLHELRTRRSEIAACEDETQALQDRLDALVDIERRMDHDPE